MKVRMQTQTARIVQAVIRTLKTLMHRIVPAMRRTGARIITKIKTRIKTVPAKTLQKKTAVPTIRSGE